MFRLEGSYPKNQRRPYVMALNPHIYRYFFSVAAMAEYLGVSRQAVEKRLMVSPQLISVCCTVKGPRFEGRRVVRRGIMYYEWRTLYNLSKYYDSPSSLYIRSRFEPRRIFHDYHIAVQDNGLFIVRMFID